MGKQERCFQKNFIAEIRRKGSGQSVDSFYAVLPDIYVWKNGGQISTKQRVWREACEWHSREVKKKKSSVKKKQWLLVGKVIIIRSVTRRGWGGKILSQTEHKRRQCIGMRNKCWISIVLILTPFHKNPTCHFSLWVSWWNLPYYFLSLSCQEKQSFPTSVSSYTTTSTYYDLLVIFLLTQKKQ